MSTIFKANQMKVHLIFLPFVTILFIAAYYSTLQWMYGRFMSPDSYYSHGFIIPFVSAYFAWMEKERLQKAAIEPNIWGLFLILLSALIHILGTVLYVFSVSGFSIFFFIVGSVLFLFGKNVTRIVAFPLIFLLFMFPVPLAFITAISFPMKMLVAKTGVEIVSLMGIPVFREGFHISIPAGQLLVGNPCSGLRSLIAFMALGAVFAHISDMSVVRKGILFFLSIPIAILSNIVRVPMLILISHFWGLDAASPDTVWHGATGVFVFVIGMMLLFILGRILKWKSSATDI